MVRVSFVGLQNGDEGKGKFVEYIVSLAEQYISVDFGKRAIAAMDNLSTIAQHSVLRNLEAAPPGKRLEALDQLTRQHISRRILNYRWQGGANAGHTIYVGDQKVVTHILPSGLVRKTAKCLEGSGMLVEPRLNMQEIKDVQNLGLHVGPDNLVISSKTHMTLDHHRAEDSKHFDLKEHTSTGKGISQTARDKYARTGIRFCEFLDADLMAQILKEKTFNNPWADFSGYAHSYDEEREFLAPFMGLEHKLFNDPMIAHHVGEGAQGGLLDIDDGSYDGTTSSNPLQPTHNPEHRFGIVKAYTSSVGIGNRAFVTHIKDSLLEDSLNEPWDEFGATTGKPRHIGWFDAVAVRYTMESAEVDYLCMSCLDKLETLAGLGVEKVKICVAYEIDGVRYDEWHESFDRRDTLHKATPIYEELDTWNQTVMEDGSLNPKAQAYVDRVGELVGKKVSLVGIGPKNKDMVVRQELEQLFYE